MRRILSVAAIVVFTVAGANASTITGKLVDLDSALTTPGSVHRIEIFLQSDQPNGISGTGFDVISATAGGAGFQGLVFNGGAANTTMAPTLAADGYATIRPSATIPSSTNYDSADAFPHPVLGVDGTGGTSAIGGSFSTTPGNVDSDPADAAAFGQSNGLELVATEKWVANATGNLNLYLTGPQFFADTSGANFTTFSTIATTGVTIAVPEPASLVLMGLAGLGLVVVGRRRSK